MQVIGLSAEEQTQIFRMLAGILWLGNVQFSERDDGNAQVYLKDIWYLQVTRANVLTQIVDTSVTEFVAYLLEVDAAQVDKVMVSKLVETQRGGRRGEILTFRRFHC